MSRLTREMVRQSIEIGRNFKMDDAERLTTLLQTYMKAHNIKGKISIVDRPGTLKVKLRVEAKAGPNGRQGQSTRAISSLTTRKEITLILFFIL